MTLRWPMARTIAKILDLPRGSSAPTTFPGAGYLPRAVGALRVRLMCESNCNVATIALAVGYDAAAAFSRASRRMVGMPPEKW